MLRILALCSTLLGSPALADLQSCQNLYAQTPLILSDLNLVDSYSYEDDFPGLGYSITFADTTSQLTIFLYDHEQQVIPPEMALDSFHQALGDITASTNNRGVELGEISAYQIQDTAQQLPLRAEARTSDGFSELLAIGVVDNCIIKLRFTTEFEIEKAKGLMDVVTGYLNEGFVNPA